MGNKIATLLRHPSHEARILLLGLKGSGKTTILFRILLNEVLADPQPRCHIETLPCINNTTLTVWDLPGGLEERKLWGHYYHLAEGVVYVVDASRRDLLTEACEVLFAVLKEISENIPVVVMLNKREGEGCVGVGEVEHMLCEGLRDQGRLWGVVECCALTGDGLREGFVLLSDLIQQK